MGDSKEDKAREMYEAEHGPPDAEEQADEWLKANSQDLQELLNRRGLGEEIEGMPLPYHLGHALERQAKAEVQARKADEDAVAKKAYEEKQGITIPKDVDWKQVKRMRDDLAMTTIEKAKDVKDMTQLQLKGIEDLILQGKIDEAGERVGRLESMHGFRDRFGLGNR